MAFEIIMDNKLGQLWDLSEIVSDLEWQTSRIGKAGSLTFTLIDGGLYEDKSFALNNGDIVRVRKDGVNVFFGYVFEISFGVDEDVKVKAYDQIRYLMNSDYYSFKGMTATEIVRKIATDTGLKLGKLADTKYKIPSMVEDGKKLLDIICKALDLTLINGSGNFYLWDDFGALSLRDISSTLADFYIGDASLMTDYDYSQSIDNETYNRIKIEQESKKAGKRFVHIEQDSANIAKWGLLQYYQSVDENLNDAQIRQLLDSLTKLKNRETRRLKLDAIGDIRVRAGSYVRIVIDKLGINQPMLADECTHKFDGADHTMSLELKVI